MGDKHLDAILGKESNEFIKSSVENLVSNPSEFEDECECDVPDCDDSQTINFLTFSNSLFDDSTSSDDESSHEEVIHKMSFKTYLNPLFDLDEEIISSEFNSIHNEDLDSTSKNDHFDTKSYLLESLLNRDESIPSGIDCDDSTSSDDESSHEECGNNLLNGFCSLCNSRNSCAYDLNPNSFDCPLDSCHPPHFTYETYSGDSCGNDSHFGYDCPP
nr:hypothetical protein [Tanacetum cinerariifolium]